MVGSKHTKPCPPLGTAALLKAAVFFCASQGTDRVVYNLQRREECDAEATEMVRDSERAGLGGVE